MKLTTGFLMVMAMVFFSTGSVFAGDNSAEAFSNVNGLALTNSADAIGGGFVNVAEGIASDGSSDLEVVNVTRSSDKKPPVVGSLKIRPGTIDSTDSDQELTLTVVMEDVSGVCISGDCGDYNSSPTQLSLKNSDSGQAVTFYEFELISGNFKKGVYVSKVIIKKGSAAGIWSVDNMLVVDKLGNCASLAYDDLKDLKE